MNSKYVRKIFIYSFILVAAYFIGGGISFFIHREDSKQTMSVQECENWGLGFSTKGQPPAGNATADELKAYDAYFIGDTNANKIYLTFDAGFENGNTPAILEALKKHKAKGTFFVVGNYIQTSPDLVKQIVEEGPPLGTHTFHHPDMSSISSMAAFEKEIKDLETLYEKTTGQKMTKFYRPPQGKYSKQNLEMAKQMGYKTFFWSLAYVDWYQDKQPSKEEAFSKLLTRIHPGSIVLLHSTSSTNAAILDELLTKWEEMGYTFGTLEELCGMESPQTNGGASSGGSSSSGGSTTMAPVIVNCDPSDKPTAASDKESTGEVNTESKNGSNETTNNASPK